MEIGNGELQPQPFTGIRLEPGIHNSSDEYLWNNALLKRLK